MPTIDEIITRFSSQGADGLKADFRTLMGAADKFESKSERMNKISGRLLGLGASGAGAMALIGKSAFGASGQLESIEAGLTSMLGSTDAAQSKIKELQDFAAKTPFSFGESAKSAQQLLAMGVAADDLVPTMKAVGNAVAAAGGGTDEFKGVLLALGQIQTKGKISQEELLQMAERGIPVFQILEKQLGLTKEQIGNIGNEGISAEKGIAALLAGMGAVGGGNALEKMSETLPGKLSNLGDSVNQLDAKIGKLFSSDAKGFISGITTATDKLSAFVDKNPELAKGLLTTFGVMAGGAVVAGGIGKMAGIFTDVAKAKDVLTGATKRDDLAEKAKAATALFEGKAIGGVGDKALETASKMGMLEKAKGLLSSPLAKGVGVVAAGITAGVVGYDATREDGMPSAGEIAGYYKNRALGNNADDSALLALGGDPSKRGNDAEVQAMALSAKMRAGGGTDRRRQTEVEANNPFLTDAAAGARESARLREQAQRAFEVSTPQQRRDGARTMTITLPESSGDRLARQARFNRLTPRVA